MNQSEWVITMVHCNSASHNVSIESRSYREVPQLKASAKNSQALVKYGIENCNEIWWFLFSVPDL